MIKSDDELYRAAIADAERAAECRQREAERLNERMEKYLGIVREWKHHWMFREPGYDHRAYGIDANMIHHLARMLADDS